MKIDDPLQYMFTQDLQKESDNFEGCLYCQNKFSQELAHAGIIDTIKMLTFPIAKGKILLRFENIADSFDPDAQSIYVNKTMVVEALWKSANQESNTKKMN